MRFKEKVVFITGAAGGIGSAVAHEFSLEGAKVFLTDVQSNNLNNLAQEISSAGGSQASERLDVTSISDIESVVSKAIDHFGQIDILVNCAGIIDVHSFDQISESLWDKILNVNAKGVFFCCQAVAKKMIARGVGGKIVNVASSYAKIGMPLYLHYCASKFAVLGITKTLALELAKYSINVNAVCPADIDTDMLRFEFKTHAKMRNISEAQVRQEFTSEYPLGRLGLPSDVANAILFLASNEAAHITGSEVNINGGMRY